MSTIWIRSLINPIFRKHYPISYDFWTQSSTGKTTSSSPTTTTTTYSCSTCSTIATTLASRIADHATNISWGYG